MWRHVPRRARHDWDENAVVGGPAAGEVVAELAEGAPRWPQAAPDDLPVLDDEPGDGYL